MQNYLVKIQSWFKSMTKKKVSYEKDSIKPAKDWTLILIATQIIVVSMMAFAFYFYIKVNNGDFFQVTTDESANEVKINNNLLTKTIADLKAKEQSFNDTKLGKEVPPDPSL